MPRFPQLTAERDHSGPAPPAHAAADNARAGSRRHCRSFTNAVVTLLALAWDIPGRARSARELLALAQGKQAYDEAERSCLRGRTDACSSAGALA